jgi:hypothetical protein
MKIGSEVECISKFYSESCIYTIVFPKYKQIYTVRDIKTDSNSTGIVLEEIRNKCYPFDIGNVEPYFAIEAFREVQLASNSDIAELTKEKELQLI